MWPQNNVSKVLKNNFQTVESLSFGNLFRKELTLSLRKLTLF